MLNGLDPILIFNFYKKLSPEQLAGVSSIPLAGFISKLSLPPIPIYLSENLTGLYLDTEEKNIDIDTTMDTLASGANPNNLQKAINSVVRVSMLANKNSIGLNIISALTDLILPKVTSQEYSLVYLNGSTTIFDGLLHSFSISKEANSDLSRVTFDIINTSKKTTVEVANTASSSLNNTGGLPTEAPPGGGAGAPTPIPPASSTPIGNLP